MHQSSYSIITRFRDLVKKHFQNDKVRILDVGSYGVNGTYKDIFSDSEKYNYVGLDLNPGPNVDYVPADPYSWPELKDETFDVIISGQAFEHIEFPWLVIEEMKRTLKKNGLICIVAPSRGPEHKYPVDCWRYYPDGFRALAKWAGLEVLEAKTNWCASGFTDGSDQWGDTFCILYKPKNSHGAIKHKRPERRFSTVVHQNNPLRSDKKSSYYGFARNEVVDALVKYQIPAGKVLEIGCAGGATGKSMKEKMTVDSYVGIELSQEAAEMARQHIDKVIVADIERTDLQKDHGLKHGEFDLLVALDVLEHLYDPWDAMKELADFVRPGGHIVVSIPNVQNISVLKELIKGKWHYEDAGILDATHLRFFTLEESEKLIRGAGLTIKSIDKVLNPPLDMSQLKDSGNRFKQGNLAITDLSKDDITNLFTYQFIVIAQKKAITTYVSSEEAQAGEITTAGGSESLQAHFKQKEAIKGLTSIVILTYNQLEYTKKCIMSIRKYTPEPHEIIFIDNGSTDGTVRWLEKLVSENNNYVLIQNTTNLGFAKGCNQGIESSHGEFVLLMNNDVIVTDGWLSGMLECLNSASDVGIVGPMTNNISGPQQIASDEYRSVDYLDEYAKKFRDRYRHRRIQLRRIVGFCMLFRRELAGKVGLFDESFGTGNFEDDDYCLRASLEGYRNMVAGDVFIHHYGSRSFIGNRIDYGSTMAGNRKVFNEKWSGIKSGTDLGKTMLISGALENADELSQKGETDKAVERLVEGIRHAPESAEFYRAMSGILLDARRYQDALDTLNSMPAEAKEDIKTLILTGYCKEGQELYEEAGGYADRVLSKEPAHASALNLKGMLEYKREDKKTAEDYFNKAIEADPGYGEPYTNLGVMKWAAGDKEEGLGLLEKGFILSPKVTDIATMYHTAITEMKEFQRAEEIFKEAKALYPLNQRVSFLLIDVLLQQGKEDAAMQEIEEAMTKFTVEEGLLAAALAVREKVGAKEIKRNKKRGSLSVSMIIKNEGQNIAKCLTSARPIADEMIVVDTGSTDRTKDIAKALGAKVYGFAWTGDFSEARNFSLSKASGDWILSLDADEVISSIDYKALKELVKRRKPAAYRIVTRNYSNEVGAQGFSANTGEYPVEETGFGWFPSTKVRLFPNDRRIRFENPVHEFLEGTVTRSGIPIMPCDIPVHHYGRLNIEKLREKGEAYYLLGKKKLEEKGETDLKAIFELGVQAGELKKYDEAAAFFERLVRHEARYPLALFNLGFVYMELCRYEEALELSKKAFELDPEKKECAVNYAHCELVAGDVDKALQLLEGTIKKNPEYPPAMGVIAAAYAIKGGKGEGISIIEELQSKQFNCANCLHDIANGLFLSGRYQQAMSVYDLIAQTKQLKENTRELVEKCYQASQVGADSSKDKEDPHGSKQVI